LPTDATPTLNPTLVMSRKIVAAAFLVASPLGAQAGDALARDSAIVAVALHETPKRHTETARVTRLAVRGDSAEVTVTFAVSETHETGHTLTLVLRDGRWTVLPTRTVFIGHFVRPRPR